MSKVIRGIIAQKAKGEPGNETTTLSEPITAIKDLDVLQPVKSECYLNKPSTESMTKHEHVEVIR